MGASASKALSETLVKTLADEFQAAQKDKPDPPRPYLVTGGFAVWRHRQANRLCVAGTRGDDAIAIAAW